MTPTPQPSFRARPGRKLRRRCVSAVSIHRTPASRRPSSSTRARCRGALKVAVSIYDANTNALLVSNADIGTAIEELRLDAQRTRECLSRRPRTAIWRLVSRPRTRRAPTASRSTGLHSTRWTPGRRPPHGQRTALRQLPALARRSIDRSEDPRPRSRRHFQPAATSRTLGARGTCSGCNHNTVACTERARWVGQQPWTSCTTSIPDPLRSLPAPATPQRRKLLGNPAGLHAGFVQQLRLDIGYAADTGRVLPHERHVDHRVGVTDLPNLHRRARGSALHRRWCGHVRRQREGQSPGGHHRALQGHPDVPGAIRHE